MPNQSDYTEPKTSMDVFTARSSVTSALSECDVSIMSNVAFKKLSAAITKVGKSYSDRSVTAEVRRLHLLIDHVTTLKRETTRDKQLLILHLLIARLREAIENAQARKGSSCPAEKRHSKRPCGLREEKGHVAATHSTLQQGLSYSHPSPAARGSRKYVRMR